MEYFVPDVIVQWNPDTIKMSDQGIKIFNSDGFIPVFKNEEDLRKHFPKSRYTKVTFSGNIIDTNNPNELIP